MLPHNLSGIAENQASLFGAQTTAVQTGCKSAPEGVPASPNQACTFNPLADFVFSAAQTDLFPAVREQLCERRDNRKPLVIARFCVSVNTDSSLLLIVVVW